MAKNLILTTIFDAVDKVSKTMVGMGRSVNRFVNQARNGMNRVEKSVSKLGGAFGGLATLIGGLAIGSAILTANLEAEKSMASLSSITGVTGKAFEGFQDKIREVSKSQKMFVGDTAKAFEIIGSMKSDLLSSADALGKVTEAAILLKKATGMELEESANALTNTLNQFGLGADQSLRVVNALAAGSKAGSAGVSQISESLIRFGSIASANNISLEESIALIETFGEKSLYSGESGTATRNMLIKMSALRGATGEAQKQLKKFGVNIDLVTDTSKPFIERLIEMKKVSKDAVAVQKIFGEDNMANVQSLFALTDTYTQMKLKIENTTVAMEQKATMTGTLSSKLEELKASFLNVTLATDKESDGLKNLKKALEWATNNIELLIKVTTVAVGAFIAFKTIMMVLTVVQWAANIAIAVGKGIQIASTAATWAMRASIIALRTVLVAAVIAQWSLNVALSANPIGLVIIGIAGLIATVLIVIKYWDEWGATLRKVFPGLALAADIIVNLYEGISKIVNIFQNNGWQDGFKAIGKVIFDFLISPIENLLILMSKIPGMASAIQPALDKISDIRKSMDVEVKTLAPQMAESGTFNPMQNFNPYSAVNPDAANVQQIIERTNSTNNSVTLDINDPKGMTKVSSNPNAVPIYTNKNLIRK
jgi:TP901 family phage tail tape measure protein